MASDSPADPTAPAAAGAHAPGASTERLDVAGERGLLEVLMQRVAAADGDFVPVVDACPEPVLVFDATRRLLHANGRAEALFGYGRRELDGQSTDVLVPERLRQPDAPPMNETPDLVQVELPGLMRDGTERPIEWRFGSVRTGGRLVFVLVVRDRLELQRAIERLQDSEQRFQLFVSGVREYAIYMLDAVGHVTSWNAGATRVKGWEAEEVVGQPFDVFFTPEDREAGLPARLLTEAARRGSQQTAGWRVRKDGSRFRVEGSLTVLRDEQGQVRGFAKITRDLTERLRAEENERHLIAEQAARRAAQQAEQRIRESEERLGRLQRVTAALSEAIIPEDVASAVLRECTTSLGAAASAVYALSEAGDAMELLGQRGHPDEAMDGFHAIPLSARAPVTDAARSRVPEFFESAEAVARAYPEFQKAIDAGSFEASAVLPLVAHGNALGTLVVRFGDRRAFDTPDRTLLLTLSDLCAQALDRARLFATERAARATAETASRVKDEFLAMLGHELRNPLAPISAALELMNRRPGQSSDRERAIIQRQVAHLERLVDDLLDVSRVASGLVSLRRVRARVADILDKAAETVGPLIDQYEHELVVSVPDPELSIEADPLRMAQVLSNLLSNAAKYTPPRGHIWLSAEREGDEAVIRVRDDGKGIDPELLPRIFDLFVQGERSFDRSSGGLGLGLAIAKNLVQLHGGRVSASSTGRGSEFVVRLRAAQSVRPEPPSREPAAAQARPGKRILLVDDNEDAAELLAEVLRLLGHEVEVAHDGPAALDRLETFPAEVAILDLGLPGMDGFELARRMKGTLPRPQPRLIALTGYGRDSDLAQTREVGFDAHLVKPVDMPVLVSAIQRADTAEPN